MTGEFEIESVLYQGERTRVCLATRRDGERYILKQATDRKRLGRIGAQLKHEMEILRHLGFYRSDELTIEDLEGFPVFARPATSRKPLNRMLATVGRLTMSGRLELALKISRYLERIHDGGVIHKDVNPSNILWDPQSGEVEIIDFGISTRLRDEAQEIAQPENLEGTLAYISPEQTGRIRRSLDHRTDLYSLGVTLFELFSGKLPFEARDMVEMVHAHLAVMPPSLSEVCPDIPQVLSDIVAILLEKEPEQRYHTAAGLSADLESCHAALQKDGRIEPFPLRKKDAMDLFRIPDRLYGRRQEVTLLLENFSEVVTGGFRLMLISGYSGIGKSVLVHQIQKPVLEWRAYFASGKFDQLQRNVPYSTLVQAFQSLIRQILKANERRIAQLRDELLEALGGNGRILVDVIPELELIIGEQPRAPELPPDEAQNRFFRLLTKFIKVFAAESHPLVIFLDDLQWADPATLGVIERIASGRDFPHLFLIGAYRENEVGPAHSLSLMLDRIKEKGAAWESLHLGPMAPDSVADLIDDAFQCGPERAASLAELCIEKTGGNPFFLQQFLQTLRSRGLIHFERHRKRWEWNGDLISTQQVTDNVVDLMTQRIRVLPEKTQRILQLAACIGNRFDLGTLSVVARQSNSQVMEELWCAMNESLILPQDSSYRYAGLETSDPAGSIPGTEVRFRFLHDRVQQASYELIPKEETVPFHLEIGRLLLQGLSPRDVSDHVFDILHHCNSGISMVTDPKERRRLADLNLEAGKKAKSAAAYGPALGYLETGLGLLARDGWETNSRVCLALHIETIEARYLNHDYRGMESLARETLARDLAPAERAAVEQIRIQALMARNEPVAAIRLALPILRQLGVRLPNRPNKVHIMAGLAATELRLRGRVIRDLEDLPEMSDPEKLAAIRILYFVFSSCYFAMPQMYPLLMYEIIRLSLAHGNAPASAIGYSAYGVVQCGLFRRVDYGNEFGQLSLNLVEKFAAREIKPRVIQVTQGFVTVYKRHPEEIINDFLDGYEAGLDSGDFEFASFTAHMRCFFLLWTGAPLKTVDREMRKYTEVIARLNQSIPLYQQKLWHQLVANLLGEAADPVRMIGEHYDETTMTAVHEEAHDSIALFFLQCCKVVLGVLFEDSDSALEGARRGESINKTGVGMGSTTVPMFYEWAALAWIDACRRGDSDIPRRTLLRRAKRCLKHVEKWARAAPIAAEYRASLVQAEIAALEGRHSDAIVLYRNSIQQAKVHRSPIDVALANHRAGEYFYRTGQDEVGRVYLGEAMIEYLRWQAQAVLDHLLKKYEKASIAALTNVERTTDAADAFARLAGGDDSIGMVTTSHGEIIDLVSVIKSAQALSGEIVLEKLLRKMMGLVIENAGANRGLLILIGKNGEMRIEAEAALDNREVAVLQSLPLRDSAGQPRVPTELISFVARTKEPVILEDAARIGDFTTDPYIAAHQSRSLICVPLSIQGRLTGFLFLENTIATNAFSHNRVNVLRALSAQASISIENARLYSNLDALNRSYARFVPHQFLDILKKDSILDVSLGDQVQGTMTVLFCDIKGFTTLSESFTVEENFSFVNLFLKYTEPAITNNGGFIDKYIGDAIMAIFPQRSDDAVRAGLQILANLGELNEDLRSRGLAPITIGAGINTGSLMLGVVGGGNRLDTTVISDAVNIASRLEAMTRFYKVPLLLSEFTWRQLGSADFTDYIRKIDRAIPKGKSGAVDVYEVFAGDDPRIRDAKAGYDSRFQEACREFAKGRFHSARKQFADLFAICPGDPVVECYLERCAAPPAANGALNPETAPP